MASTGFVFHPDCLRHEPGRAHPERPGRLQAVHARLQESGAWKDLDVVEPREASTDEILAVHAADHLTRVRAACDVAPIAIDGDTAVSTGSWRAALLAAGGLLEACDRVLSGDWANAFCAVRPPGHHAEVDRAMGFCLFNNVAVAARYLQTRHGLERIAILDWDVHHGNGTQHVFERDAHVFYASLHQWPLYPGTGAEDERGLGAGEGTTLNRPMNAGSTDADWLGELETHVLPALEAFKPEFVLVSAGFDAHRLDPLAGVNLSADGFRALTRRVLELAQRTANGRLVSVLEGGYHLEALAASAEAHVEELLGGDECD